MRSDKSKMSLDKTSILKLNDSSGKIHTKETKKIIEQPFCGKDRTDPDHQNGESFKHNG